MSESFGGRLRERREAQAIALATIAQRTKIKESLLEGLERDDLSHWPSGIFRRAYVRSYAEAIGLNGDLVVREFLARYPDPSQLFPAEPLPPPEATGGRTQAPPTRLSYLLGSIGGRRHSQSPSPIPRPSPAEAPLVVDPAPVAIPASNEPDLVKVAELCAGLGRIGGFEDLERQLQEARLLLHATGIIVWVWDEPSEELRPVLAAGYSEKVLARVPALRRDADNPTAEAFRSGRLCGMHAAVVAPIVTATGCAGVLAVEMSEDGVPATSVQAAAGIIAAFLALLMGQSSGGEGESTLTRASGATS